jgi:dihydroorotate dehydrogenase electron transfer subunit
MAKDIYIGEISSNEEIQENCFLMKVILPVSLGDPQPGQFVMIRISGLYEPLLARPISIYSFSRGKDSCAMELLYSVVGKGTQILAGLISGSQVEIHGPLGRGFEIDEARQNIVFIAGGMGIAPLSLLTEHLCGDKCFSPSAMTFYLGARTAKAVVGLDKLQKLCYNINVCTDDGTLGEKGLVTQAFQKDIKKYLPANTAIYACGPKEMLKSLAKMLRRSKFFSQASLEERMACGIGACLGCAVAVKDNQGALAYQRVCADGPVFNLLEVIWE